MLRPQVVGEVAAPFPTQTGVPLRNEVRFQHKWVFMPIILAVDDDVDVIATIKKSLTKAGYQVTGATSSSDAWQTLSCQRPDLVLLDIALPGMDGIELCRQLRANPVTASLPILFLTVSGDMQSKTAAFDAGADDYLVKPFDLQELGLRVKALLQREEPGLVADNVST